MTYEEIRGLGIEHRQYSQVEDIPEAFKELQDNIGVLSRMKEHIDEIFKSKSNLDKIQDIHSVEGFIGKINELTKITSINRRKDLFEFQLI